MQQASAQRDIIDMMKSLNEIILKEGKKLDWSSFQSDVAVLREQDSTWYRGRIFEDSDDLRKTSGDCPLVFNFRSSLCRQGHKMAADTSRISVAPYSAFCYPANVNCCDFCPIHHQSQNDT